MAWAYLAAVSAGYTALLFKCIATLAAKWTVQPDDCPLHHWQSYLLVVAAFSVAPLELHCLNLALQYGEAVAVVPAYLSLGMLSQLSTGSVFFQELQTIQSFRQGVEFFLSVCLTLSFVVAMTLARSAEVEQTPEPKRMSLIAAEAEVTTERREGRNPKVQVNLTPEVEQYQESIEANSEGAALKRFSTSPPRRATEHRLSVAGIGGAFEALDAAALQAIDQRCTRDLLPKERRG